MDLERRRAVEQVLEGVRSDQGLVSQISPAGMEVFNASTQDRAEFMKTANEAGFNPAGLIGGKIDAIRNYIAENPERFWGGAAGAGVTAASGVR